MPEYSPKENSQIVRYSRVLSSHPRLPGQISFFESKERKEKDSAGDFWQQKATKLRLNSSDLIKKDRTHARVVTDCSVV